MVQERSLTWIHISDLHFGHGSACTRFEQRAVTEELVRDAELMSRQLGPPDLVCLTGDIAYSASPDTEYSAAAAWLQHLVSELKIGLESVLLVPGNHDVDRKVARDGVTLHVHKGLRVQPDDLNDLLEVPDRMAAIWPKLSAYANFSRNYGSPRISANKPFWTLAIPTCLGSTRVIGLNTVLLSFDNTDAPTTLALGRGQRHRALAAVPRDTLLIIMQHHPPEWLCDGREFRAELQKWPHILLAGHLHEQEGTVRLPFTSGGGIDLMAGAVHVEHQHDKGAYAYAWGRLHTDGLEYYPREWSARNQAFLAQHIDAPRDLVSWHQAFGEFVSIPVAGLPIAMREWLSNGGTAHMAPLPKTSSISMAESVPNPGPHHVYVSFSEALQDMLEACQIATDLKILTNKGLRLLGTDYSLISMEDIEAYTTLRKIRILLMSPSSRWITKGLIALRRHESLETFVAEMEASHRILEAGFRRLMHGLPGLSVTRCGVKYFTGEPCWRLIMTETTVFVTSYADGSAIQVRDLPVCRFDNRPGSFYTAFKRHFNNIWHNDAAPGPTMRDILDLSTTAGGLVHVEEAGEHYVVLLGRHDGFWVLPKGHKKREDETLERAAVREVANEIGLDPTLLRVERYLDKYADSDGDGKGDVQVVHIFHIKYVFEERPSLTPDADHTAAVWWKVGSQIPEMRFPYQLTLLAEFAQDHIKKPCEER